MTPGRASLRNEKGGGRAWQDLETQTQPRAQERQQQRGERRPRPGITAQQPTSLPSLVPTPQDCNPNVRSLCHLELSRTFRTSSLLS